MKCAFAYVLGLTVLRGRCLDDTPGVALPFRDLRQPMRNITYFASLIRKMRSLQHTLWTELVHKAKLIELTIYKVSRRK